tara:strand:+ start:239 stop:664 length:426 start_codon:yes stop_codon:yes gene_type:complete
VTATFNPVGEMAEEVKSDAISKAGYPSQYKPEYPKLLIQHMESGLSFTTFGAIAEVSRKTLYEWVDKFPDFKQAKSIAFAKSQKFYEELLMAKALDSDKRHDMSAIIFALKTRFREDYSEKQDVEHSGEVKITISENESRL